MVAVAANLERRSSMEERVQYAMLQGWLTRHKSARFSLRHDSKLWYVLQGTQLTSHKTNKLYATEHPATVRQQARGVLDVGSAEGVQPQGDRGFIIVLNASKTYHFIANNAEERDRWVRTLQEAQGKVFLHRKSNSERVPHSNSRLRSRGVFKRASTDPDSYSEPAPVQDFHGFDALLDLSYDSSTHANGPSLGTTAASSPLLVHRRLRSARASPFATLAEDRVSVINDPASDVSSRFKGDNQSSMSTTSIKSRLHVVPTIITTPASTVPATLDAGNGVANPPPIDPDATDEEPASLSSTFKNAFMLHSESSPDVLAYKAPLQASADSASKYPRPSAPVVMLNSHHADHANNFQDRSSGSNPSTPLPTEPITDSMTPMATRDHYNNRYGTDSPVIAIKNEDIGSLMNSVHGHVDDGVHVAHGLRGFVRASNARKSLVSSQHVATLL